MNNFMIVLVVVSVLTFSCKESLHSQEKNEVFVEDEKLQDAYKLLASKNIVNQITAAEALHELSLTESVPYLLKALKRNRYEKMGGSEMVSFQRKLDFLLIGTIVELTKIKAPETTDDAVDWASDRDTDDKILHFISKVDDWILNKE